MNILKLELKKTNIKPYFLSAIAIFVCIMGLTYILAWVPHLDSGDKNAANLFSTYQGITAVSNAIALMSFSILASAMGFRYLTKEYCGGNAILLFSYPMNRNSVVWAKVAVILLLVNPVAAINEQFLPVLLLAATMLLAGILLTINLSHKVNRMEL